MNGQCDTVLISPAKKVVCGPNCTYIIGMDGSVSVVGVVIDQSIRSWESISSLVCGSYHVLGLTTDKKVRIAGQMLEESMTDLFVGKEK